MIFNAPLTKANVEPPAVAPLAIAMTEIVFTTPSGAARRFPPQRQD
jgi:hypothetical protein